VNSPAAQHRAVDVSLKNNANASPIRSGCASPAFGWHTSHIATVPAAVTASSHTSQQLADLLRREVVQDVAEEYDIVVRAEVVNRGITCPVGHDIIETLSAAELLSLLDRLWKVNNLRPHWRMSACDQCAVQAVGARNVQQSLCAGPEQFPISD
jgi:hypothetical protein